MRNKKIREAREEAGMTLTEAAIKSGVSFSTWQAIEIGRIPGNYSTKRKIAKLFDVPFDEMFPEETEEIKRILSLRSLKEDRSIYLAIKKHITFEEKEWLFEHNGDYPEYQRRLRELAKKHNIEINQKGG